MPRKRAYLEELQKVPLFQSLNTRDLQKVSKRTTEQVVPPGEPLTDQGQTGREAFIIVDGSVTVKRNGKKIATLGPGQMVGELSLLDHGPRTATVTADGQTTVLVLTAQEFSSLLDEVPAITHKLLATLAGRIRDLDRKNYD